MAEDREENPLEQLVELLVYAPVGLLYEYDEVLPKLVRRGKSQLALARFLGRAAVRRSSSTAEDALGEVVSTGAGLVARAVTELGAAVGLAPDGSARPTGAPPPPPPPPPPPSRPASAVVPVTEAAVVPAEDATVVGPPRSSTGPGTTAPDVVDAEPAPAEPGTAGRGPSRVAEADGGPLPIAGYDDLTARVIVSLLDDLTPAQRERVRRHEEANRSRKTVLAKLDRLDRR